MKRYQFIPTLFWIGLSLFVMVFSCKLGLEDKTGLEGVHNPGPGLMPFLASLLLLLISLYLLVGPLLKKEQGKPIESGDGKRSQLRYGKMLLVLGSLFGYAFLIEPLGYLVTTSLALLLLFRGMGTRWGSAVFASVATTLITYFVFTYLGLLFPDGIIKLQGVIR